MFCDCAALCCIMTDKLTCYLVIQQQLFIFLLKIYHVVGFAAFELRVHQKNMKNLVFKIETICTIREGQSYGDWVHCLI